jgi:hypothetical protein
LSDKRTKDWVLFEAGKQYNNRLKPNFYETVNLNHEFVSGNQWIGLEDQEMPKPTFNILKRILGFFIASLTSSKTKIHFEPLMYAQDNPDNSMQAELKASEIANAQVSNLFEKFKMDFRIKDTLFDAATAGDGCLHFYFDPSKRPFGGAYSDIRGEIQVELVDNANVYFGNANTPRVDIQPYIIVTGRDMVENLKEEAKRFKQKGEELNNIQADKNFSEQSSESGKIEVDADDYGKALYIIVYRKKKVKRKKFDQFGNEVGVEEVETITASKSVENAYIYKDIDTGLTTYPVAWLNWEKQKNQYHGRALVTGMIPNQIFINRMFAMVMYHLMMSAFPKTVINGDLVPNFSNQIGEAVVVRGMDASDNIKNVVANLEPGNMSAQIIQAIELAFQYTKETLGISDAAMGNIDPKNTSAIIAVQKSSAIPLENPRSNLYEFIENVGEILLDFMGTYYGKRPVSIEQDAMKKIVEFDFSVLKNMFLNIRADVGEASYWSELSSIQTLDNLLNNGHVDIVDYLERVPVEYIPQKDELIASIKKRMQATQPNNDPSALIAQLSPEEQQAFNNAPPEVQQKILAELQAPAM